MSEQIDDKAFEEYLSRQGPVSQRYRELEASEPPPTLDRLVLERAAQAVERKRNKPVWRTWGVPVALAASMALAIAVVIDSGVTPTAQKEVSSRALSRAEVPAVEERAPETDAPAETRDSTQPAPALAPMLTTADKPVDRRAADARERAQELAAARQRASAERKSEEVTVSGVRPQEVVRATRVPELVPPPPGMEQDAAPAPVEQRAAAPSRTETRSQPDSPGAASVEEIAVTGQLRRRPASGVGPRGTVRRSPSVAADQDWVDEEARRESDPALWLDYIRELRRDRKNEEADREWAEFRSVYPGYDVAETDVARPQR